MKMKILVVGNGGREHALVWKLAQSPMIEKLYCAPGSDAIASLAECVNIKAEAVDALADFVAEQNIDLTVIGPEAPLVAGLADRLEAMGRKVFGPSQAAARLEGSKAFAKEIMIAAGVPTASYGAFSDINEALNYIEKLGAPLVVKADGLAAGKGVYVCHTKEEAVSAVNDIMGQKRFGSAGANVVIEEFLEGEEASLLVLVDGENILPLASAQDHKAVFDGDNGPNTGGMGAYSPAPVLDDAMLRKAVELVVKPVVDTMKQRGIPYKGVLYAGLMINNGIPYVLEFNCRFGDPETQPVLSRIDGDLLPAILAACDGTLDGTLIKWKPQAAVCVVLASGGYPDDYDKGFEISGLEEASAKKDIVIFHAGTRCDGGRWFTNGGRVLGVTALGSDVAEAKARAYEAVACISWKGMHYRKDIADKALNKK